MEISKSPETRECLLEAAQHLFAAHGYHGASIRDIVRACRVSNAALYYHFGSKQGLYSEVLRAYIAAVVAKLQEAGAGKGTCVSRLSRVAMAYAAIANNGYMVTPTLVRTDSVKLENRVLPKEITRQLRYMLERAAGTKGTGRAADIAHYRVAGKTGTVHKLIDGQYAEDRYMGLFAGMVPASNPRLVMIVTIDDPHRGGYFGGQIAAPVFRKVMSGALRLLDIAPDQPHKPGPQVVQTRSRPAV